MTYLFLQVMKVKIIWKQFNIIILGKKKRELLNGPKGMAHKIPNMKIQKKYS